MIKKLLLLVALTFVSMTTFAAAALACTVDVCAATQGFLIPDGDIVPQNLSALLWFPVPSHDLDPTSIGSDVEVWRVEEGVDVERIEVEIKQARDGAYLWPGYELVLQSPLAANAAYRVSAPAVGCRYVGAGRLEAEFETGPPAALPLELGELVSKEIQHGPLMLASDASCVIRYETAHQSIEFIAHPAVEPWMGVLFLQTYVDGEPWKPQAIVGDYFVPGESWVGRQRDLLYNACAVVRSEADEERGVEPAGPPSQRGLEPGQHHVTMKAWLPGTAWAAETPQLEVELECAASEQSGVETSAPDAGIVDTGFDDRDAGRQDEEIALERLGQTENLRGCGSSSGGGPVTAFVLLVGMAAWLRPRKEGGLQER